MMKRITLTLLIFMVLFSACTKSQKEQEVHSSITPSLLDRHEFIQNGKEWERVQNSYAAALLKVSKDQTNVDAYLKLAEVFINEARITGEHGHYYPGALKVLNKGLSVEDKTDDQEFQLLSLKASVMLSQHEFQTALALGKKAQLLNPYNAQIYGVLVDAFVELGDYENAVLMADKMINIRPDLRSYSRVSYLRELHGDIHGAIEAMNLAVAAGYPGTEQTAWARLTLGNLHQKKNDLVAAQQQFELVLEERKNYPFALAALAQVYFEKGEEDKAESILLESIDIIPEVGFYEQMAVLFKRQNRHEELVKIKKEILLMLEDDVSSGHNMNMEYASLYLDLFEDSKKALSYAKKEYKKRPDNVEVNKLLALIYQEEGANDLAKNHAQKALKTGAIFPELSALNPSLSFTRKK